jgi:hypothetical protein
VDIPATSDAIPGTLVLRDASGNLSAGTVAADLTGNVAGDVIGSLTGNITGDVAGNVTGDLTGNVTGNSSTATALQTSRTIELTGDVTGSASFNGTANASISANIGSGVIVDADINAAAGIVDTKLATITTAGKVANSATTGTSSSTADTLALRDSDGSCSFVGLKTADTIDVLYATRGPTGAQVVPFRINHTDGSGRVNISWNVDGGNHNIGTANYFFADPAVRLRVSTEGFTFFTAPTGVAGDPIPDWTVGLYNSIEGRVAVGTVTPDAAAALEVNSTTRGFLPPRMTTTERNAIASPPAGLMIYNTTTNKLNVRTASSWEAVTSA